MKIFIIGFGKMGKEIARLAEKSGHSIHGIANTFDELKLKQVILQESDIAIEFTNPQVVFQNLSFCLESGVPVVCGTTGWYQHLETIKTMCNNSNGGFFHASNFSIGVNVFFRINQMLAHLMNEYKEYTVSIEEIHHIHKKDQPSGTAITLAEGIIGQMDRLTSWTPEPGADDKLVISSLRTDMVPGTHKVTYSSSIDDIEICHTAHNREGFASGALKAAQWMLGRKGCFTMDDLLGKL